MKKERKKIQKITSKAIYRLLVMTKDLQVNKKKQSIEITEKQLREVLK